MEKAMKSKVTLNLSQLEEDINKAIKIEEKKFNKILNVEIEKGGSPNEVAKRIIRKYEGPIKWDEKELTKTIEGLLKDE